MIMIKDNEVKDTKREISYLVCQCAAGIVFLFFMFILSSALYLPFNRICFRHEHMSNTGDALVVKLHANYIRQIQEL